MTDRQSEWTRLKTATEARKAAWDAVAVATSKAIEADREYQKASRAVSDLIERGMKSA